MSQNHTVTMNTQYKMPPITTTQATVAALHRSRLHKIYWRIVIAHIAGLLCYIFLLIFAATQMPVAALIGDYETINVMTAVGFSADSCDPEMHVTPLMEAALGRYTGVVKLLLQRGANINAENCWGTTPLDYVRGDPKMALLLLEHGADINHIAKDGDSPLIGAAHSGNLELVKLFIAHGANPAQRDKEGHDARYRAEFNGHIDVLRFLKHLPKTRTLL